MVPVGSLSGRLHRVARDLAAETGRGVHLGAARRGHRGGPEPARASCVEALLHLVRNAVGHGLEPAAVRVAAGKDPVGRLRLHAMRLGAEVVVTVTDDGRGPRPRRPAPGGRAEQRAPRAAELAFRPGVSTAGAVTDVSGRGVGLDAVRVALDRARGRVEVTSTPGVGTEFRVVLPMSLSLLRCLVCAVGEQRFAPPAVRGRRPVPGMRGGLGPDGGPVDRRRARVPVTAAGPVLGCPRTGRHRGGRRRLRAAPRGRRRRAAGPARRRRHRAAAVPAAAAALRRGVGAGDGGVLLVLDPTGLVADGRPPAAPEPEPRPPTADAPATSSSSTTPPWSASCSAPSSSAPGTG